MGSQLVHAIYHGYVQHGPALPLRSLGRIYARGSPRIRTRPDPHARRIQGFLMVILQYLEGKQLAWKRRTDDFLMGKHWLLLTVAGFAIAGVVGVLLWWVWNVWIVRGERTSGGRSRLPFWRRISGKERYELLDRMA